MPLRVFWLQSTRACVPDEAAYRTWFDTVEDFRVVICGLDLTPDQYDRYRALWGALPADASTPSTERATTLRSAASTPADAFIRPGRTPLRAAHFHELRERIAVLRKREDLPPVAWTDPTLVAGVTPVRAVHLTELRAALDAVYEAVGRARPSYTDAAVTVGATPVNAIHLTELRAAVAALE